MLDDDDQEAGMGIPEMQEELLRLEREKHDTEMAMRAISPIVTVNLEVQDPSSRVFRLAEHKAAGSSRIHISLSIYMLICITISQTFRSHECYKQIFHRKAPRCVTRTISRAVGRRYALVKKPLCALCTPFLQGHFVHCDVSNKIES